jgi:hypothetical protein
MSDKGTFETIITEVSRLLKPIATAYSAGSEGIDSFCSEAGIDLDIILKPASVQDLNNAVKSIVSIYNSLSDIAENGTIDLSKLPDYINDIKSVVSAFDALNNLQLNSGIPAEFANIGNQLFDYLVINYLFKHHPDIYFFLLFCGILDDGSEGDYPIPKLHLSRVPTLMGDPKDIASIVYKWGTNDFRSSLILLRLNPMLAFLGLPTSMEPIEDAVRLPRIDADNTIGDQQLRIPLYEEEKNNQNIELGVAFVPLAQDGAKSKGIGIAPYGVGDFSDLISLDDNWKLRIKASIEALSPWGIGIRPEGDDILGVNNSSAPSKAQLQITIERDFGDGQRYILLGTTDGPRIELGTVGLKFGLEYDGELDFFIELPIRDLRAVINAGEGDGFLKKVLPKKGVESNFDLALGFSLTKGIYFRGCAGLEISLATHIALGPLEFQSLKIALKIIDGKIPITIGAGIKADLGPLKATVENMGIKATFSFPDSGGNLGPADLSLGFKPPNGVGLVVDAGVVKGGGYLFFDFDKGEYAGALELTFSEFLSLKAIGLISTKMPDGSQGFSLIIIITAEFVIQLGYGFVFLGAGGLLGLNRTVKLQPLAEGVRSGATANILFPTNIVENAPRIISDMRIFFSIENNKFLIGPMVKLGWGTPTLISIALGIVIEIRINEGGGIERIAILGVLKCILPDEEAALLVLQVNFIGAIDFEKKVAFFFASIFESRLLFITIEGEMGVLVAWGEDANFLVSVGGFHPRFSPPPLPFPVPKRVAFNILNQPWGKIRVEGYFAVTTNTVQFGAKLELYFGFSALKIEGHVGFDALFQFDPFYFIIEISGKVSLKVFGIGLFSISLKFSLEGPTPWHAKGYGKIKFLFFSIKARFDKTWGSSRNTTLPPIEALPILEKEFLNIQNWQAVAPDSNNLLVSLRKLDDTSASSVNEIALHPIGTLRISQRAVPLKIRLDKIGNQKPEDANRFEIEAGGAFTRKGDIKESFARAQFQDLKDSKKLSSPAYEKEVGGLELSATGRQFRSGKMTVRHVRYELITIDTAYKRFKLKFFSWLQVLFGHFFMNNAASLSKISYRTKKELQPFTDGIKVFPDEYVVVFNKNNKPYTKKSSKFSSHASAEDFMAQEIGKNPQIKELLHVIPSSEVNKAA